MCFERLLEERPALGIFTLVCEDCTEQRLRPCRYFDLLAARWRQIESGNRAAQRFFGIGKKHLRERRFTEVNLASYRLDVLYAPFFDAQFELYTGQIDMP